MISCHTKLKLMLQELTSLSQLKCILTSSFLPVARQKKVGVSSNTTSPDSGTSLSPGIDPLTRQPRAELQPAGGVQDTLEHTYDELPWPHTQDNNMASCCL